MTWSSNNNKVATVTTDGKVTAIAKGVATITAETADGVTATCKVTVNKADNPVNPSENEPTGISLNKETLTLKANESETLTATVSPATAENKAVTWSTNNAGVAAVTNSGRVTAISAGVATISARTANGLSATCKVTVTKADDPVNPPKNEPTSIKLDQDAITLEVNGTETLTATVAPGNGRKPQRNLDNQQRGCCHRYHRRQGNRNFCR